MANVAMSFFFALCAYVQLNDPDALQWVATYAVTALACLALGARGGNLWLVSLVSALALVLIAAAASTIVVPAVRSLLLWGPSQHAFEAEEEVRELVGLIIAGGWMIAQFPALGTSLKSRNDQRDLEDTQNSADSGEQRSWIGAISLFVPVALSVACWTWFRRVASAEVAVPDHCSGMINI